MANTRHCSMTTTSSSCCAKLLLKTFLTIFIFVQLQANVSGAIYESVQWISNNPRFVVGKEDKNCNEGEVLEIRVTVGSKLTFICPTSVMVLGTMQHDIPKESLYENLWIVHDERSFNTCTVPIPQNGSKYLLSCKEPLKLVYLSIIFNLYSATDHLAFPYEKYYYFFSTSDGTVGTLHSKASGHCNDKSKKVAMKFRLFLCKEASTHPKCNETSKFPFGKFRCVSNRTATPVPTSTPSPSASPTQTLPGVPPTSSSQLNTAITVTSSVSQEPSGSPQLAKQTGSKDKSELRNWMVATGFCIFLCVVLAAVVVYIVRYFKYKKKDTCFRDLNKVDSVPASKNDKHENPDGGIAEEGNVTLKRMYGVVQETDRKGLCRLKSVTGHGNPGYRESISGNHMSGIQRQNSTEVIKEGQTEDCEVFDAADGSKSIPVFPDVITNTAGIESSFKGDRSAGYEMLRIGPKHGLKGKNLINSGGKEIKVKADESSVGENKSSVIENGIPNGTPRSKRVDVRA